MQGRVKDPTFRTLLDVDFCLVVFKMMSNMNKINKRM